ncbi:MULTISPECIES: type II toxin-antitoxin system VapC family toxin [Methylosinus]|uniref:PIN domain-containing protein n=1 Tax=Methylosinus trichosporium (strain ATCC 35070 / NCIMB 11131 / UNIQEM 75 / OB3b) TaxID=595536 RepID=A0A2D2D6D5_METT3|nr:MULTISPECIES: type II toxin-antitoxin system VapC family toxin [Methylosinus]ATQ70581.1 PIN domain-containing protein [Methylosinus trichosporium OB3b]OBS51062.1 twitching motility protein PilT [Methylosinus sp. 3S-1]
MYLLDTNVVSELRRAKPHGAVLSWLQSVPDSSLRLSALTLGEIQAGVEKLRSRNREKAEEIENWADQIEQTFAVVPVDARIFRLHARWMHARPDHCYEDALIAATAKIHDLVVVTRNAKDFACYDIALLDPFTFSGGK